MATPFGKKNRAEITEETLRRFHKSGARYLVTSVPYFGFQIAFSLHVTPYIFAKITNVKLGGNRLCKFRHDSDPMGHKWEVGWRGYSVRKWKNAIRDAGWHIRKRDFTGATRSIFHLYEA